MVRLVFFFVKCLILMGLFRIALVQGQAAHANFSENQEDQEVLVGENAIFSWKYSEYPSGTVTSIAFGNIVKGAEVKILFTGPNRELQSNQIIPLEKLQRVTALTLNVSKAIFQIANVTFNDSGTYFCKLRVGGGPLGKEPSEMAKVRVVDVLMDKEKSDSRVESWDGHKIHLQCSVRRAKGTGVSFSWSRRHVNDSADSHTMEGLGHIRSTTNQSVLTIVTTKREDFHPYVYVCTARGARTIQEHVITVTQLYKPGPPLNVSVTDTDNASNADCKAQYRLTWTPPRSTGGTVVTSYRVEVRPTAEEWSVHAEVLAPEALFCKIQKTTSPRSAEVRVLAKNRVGLGHTPSGIIGLDFWSTPSAPRSLIQNPYNAQCVNLTWSMPLTDGGKEITAYVVEHKLPEIGWDMAATEKTTERWFRFEGRKRYDARVRAENEIGVGPPSEVIRIKFTAVEDETAGGVAASLGVKHRISQSLWAFSLVFLISENVLKL